jgi:ADP-heptose:LPS heptosyltransferase
MAVVSPRLLPDHPTVIVLRALPGLGDWLCAEPTLRAIRAARPAARIHLVGLAPTRPLIGRYDGLIDGFHAFPGWPGLPERRVDVAAIPGFLAALQGLEADLAIQLHGSGGITNELVELFGARNVAGCFSPSSRRPDPLRFVAWRETEPEVRRGLRLLSVLGIEAHDASLRFPLDPAGRQRARRLLEDAGVRHGHVVVHPGSNHAANRWPGAAFAAVGRAIAREAPVVITGGPDERHLTREVASAVPGAVDLGGRTDLDALGWIVRSARLLVTNDTGVSHVADALRVPSVVAFANDDGRRAARWAPLDRELHAVVTGDRGDRRQPSIAAVTARALEQLGRRRSVETDTVDSAVIGQAARARRAAARPARPRLRRSGSAQVLA